MRIQGTLETEGRIIATICTEIKIGLITTLKETAATTDTVNTMTSLAMTETKAATTRHVSSLLPILRIVKELPPMILRIRTAAVAEGATDLPATLSLKTTTSVVEASLSRIGSSRLATVAATTKAVATIRATRLAGTTVVMAAAAAPNLTTSPTAKTKAEIKRAERGPEQAEY